MNNLLRVFACISLITISSGCEKWFDDEEDPGELKGEQSAMGQPGVKFDSFGHGVAGVSDITATVETLEDGVSVIRGSAIVTNPVYKEILKGLPEVQIKGDTINVKDVKMRMTTEGFELLSGPTPGIIAKYSSKVGDTYPMGTEGQVRTVIEKTDQNDYPYGFMFIKTMKVEEITNADWQAKGVTKIHYFANHKFGLVGVHYYAGDSIIEFPVYSSAENSSK